MHDDDFGDFDDDCDVAFPVIRVHELSEFVFCPRAGVIAHETAAEDTGEESSEPGPRLGGYWDYTEHRFTEEIQTVRRNLLYWLLLTIPSVALILVIRAYVSLIAAAIAAGHAQRRTPGARSDRTGSGTCSSLPFFAFPGRSGGFTLS